MVTANLVLIVSALWVFASLLSAQQTTKSAPKASAASNDKRKPSSYSETAFQLNANGLPPLYKGHDVVRIGEVLAQRKANALKGEFETSAQWQARLKAEASAPTVGTLGLSSLYAFALDDGRLSDEAEDPATWYRYRRIQAEYDSDKNVFDVYIAFGEGVWTPDGKLDRSDARKTLTAAQTSVEPYYEVKGNAFGATVRVKVTHDTMYEILASNLNAFPTAQHDDRAGEQVAWLHTAFTASSDKARAIKQNIRAIAICTLLPPFFRAGKIVDIGTFESPQTQFIDFNYIDADVVSIWIYDTVSGEVYAKVDPKTSLK